MSDLVPHLTDLAEKINHEHQQAETALRAGLAHARNAGELLIQAKGQLQHGDWLPWLQEHVHFSERTAQCYMRLAREWDSLQAKAQRVADLSYRDAIALLAEASEPEEPNPQRVADLNDSLPFLAPLLDAGLLNAEHVSALLPLRRIYGQQARALDLADVTRESCWEVLRDLRPEEVPALWPTMTTPPTAVQQALVAFNRCLSGSAGQLPQWQVAACWWGCVAAWLRLPAARLALRIDAWRQRYESALVFLHLHPTEPDPGEEADAADASPLALWWAFRADLEHSGSLDRPAQLEQESDYGMALLGRNLNVGSYLLPSIYQAQSRLAAGA